MEGSHGAEKVQSRAEHWIKTWKEQSRRHTGIIKYRKTKFLNGAKL